MTGIECFCTFYPPVLNISPGPCARRGRVLVRLAGQCGPMNRSSPYRIVPLSEFRRHASREVAWVRHMGGRVWLTYHGRQVAAVVPVNQCELLETWESRSLDEERRRMEELYQRWKAIKARAPDSKEPFPWEISGQGYR